MGWAIWYQFIAILKDVLRYSNKSRVCVYIVTCKNRGKRIGTKHLLPSMLLVVGSVSDLKAGESILGDLCKIVVMSSMRVVYFSFA